MRSFGGLFDHIVAFANVVSAAERAARSRRHQPEVASFFLELEPRILTLQAELREGSYRPGHLRTFRIREPKLRTITVSPFRDRVAQHAAFGILEPVLERLAIHDSHACRRGHGVASALARTQHFARRSRYFLKLDVASYFASIDHGVLLGLITRRFREPELVSLLARMMAAPGSGLPAGRGLPIGSLSSQHLANFYLGELDRMVIGQLLPAGYVRYMDDIIVFGDSREEMWEYHAAMEYILHERLLLDLKHRATIVSPVTEGIPFLGRRVYPGVIVALWEG